MNLTKVLFALFGCCCLLAPTLAFPSSVVAKREFDGTVDDVAAAAEFTIEELSFGDWIKIIEDKIDGVINSAKEIGAIAVEKLEQIGQEALEKLVSATGSVEDALDKFVEEILPKIIAKATSVAGSGVEGFEQVATAVVAVLRKLGVKAHNAAVIWVKEHKDILGEALSDLILSKIQEIRNLRVAEFGMYSQSVEYLKEKIMDLMKLAFDEAVILANKIIYVLKTYGIPALKAALEYVEEMKCELGEMVYRMLFNKINAALGIETFDALQTLAFKDWLEAVGGKIKEIIEAGKQVGKDAIDSIKDLGQEALDKLIQASASIKEAKEKFVEQVLPKILEKMKDIAGKGEEGAAKVADAIVGVLKKLGASGLRMAIDWLEKNKGDIGKNIYDKIVAKIEEALNEVGLYGPAPFGLMATAEEYVEAALSSMGRAGYDGAVYLVDKMISFLKTFGVAALRLAEKLVELNKCLIGGYIYGMAMSKIKVAIKAAVISGVVG